MKTMKKIPTYKEAVELCSFPESPFYESKLVVDGYNISIFNYRLAQGKDFSEPIPEKPELKGHEMRGLTFVFNEDGSLFNRFLLLEKFFNLNQVPETTYSIVKNYKIKSISNKEDGSIASFIKLPNGKVIGKSKMGFDNEQAIGINRVYRKNKDVKSFVDWCLSNDITAIFEYVSPNNRIVLEYPNEELILLRLRDNVTGKHIDIRDHSNKIGSIRIAPFEDKVDLDQLIELAESLVDKEGWIVNCLDEFGDDFFFKIKTKWYVSLHGLLTNDLNRENIIIGHILDDKIDDILGQIPEENETHERINRIISIVKVALNEKSEEIKIAYNGFVNSGLTKKEYALSSRKNTIFPFVMNMVKANELRNLSKDEISAIYDNIEDYERTLQRCDPYEMSVEWLRDKTKRLKIAREWLLIKDPNLFFQEMDD